MTRFLRDLASLPVLCAAIAAVWCIDMILDASGAP
jgi:hypothetical protein